MEKGCAWLEGYWIFAWASFSKHLLCISCPCQLNQKLTLRILEGKSRLVREFTWLPPTPPPPPKLTPCNFTLHVHVLWSKVNMTLQCTLQGHSVISHWNGQSSRATQSHQAEPHTHRNLRIAFLLAKIAGAIVQGCVCTMTTMTMTKFHNMTTIIQLVGHAMLANSINILDIHFMVNLQLSNKVSTGKYHVTILQAQILSSSRSLC